MAIETAFYGTGFPLLFILLFIAFINYLPVFSYNVNIKYIGWIFKLIGYPIHLLQNLLTSISYFIKNPGIYIILLLALSIILILIAPISKLNSNLNENKDIHNTISSLKKWQLSTAIILGVLGFIALIMIYLNITYFNHNLNIWTIAGGLILIPLVPLIYSSYLLLVAKDKKDVDKKFKECPGLLPPNCPELNFVSIDLLKEIIEKLNHFYVKGDNQNFNKLFEKLIANENVTINDIDEILNDMTSDALQNQSIYLLFQLLQCRLKIKTLQAQTVFGTKQWWLDNMINTTPILKYTYVISVILCFIFLTYYWYKIIGIPFINQGDNTIIGNFDINNLFESIFSYGGTFLVTIIFGLVLAFQNGFFTHETIYTEKKVDPKLQPYVLNPNKDKKTHDTSSDGLLNNFGFGKIILILALGISLFTNLFLGNDNIGKSLTKNIGLILLGFIIVFNIYYMFLIPQIVIVGIILQKYILQTPFEGENPILGASSLVKIISIVFVLFASLLSTTYKSNSEEKEVKETFNKPVWFSFGILCSFLLLNIVDTFVYDHYLGEYTTSWSPLFIPLFKYLYQFISGDKFNMEYDQLSIQNTF